MAKYLTNIVDGVVTRKMDPQPVWEKPPILNGINPNLWHGEYTAWCPCWGYLGQRVEARSSPADMPSATPWQDRDGVWYWRMELKP